MTGKPLEVALVYPPFGPAGLPSLGLALLSAGVKARGHGCRTLYWNFDLVAHMPGATLTRRLDAYRSLSGRMWHPFNEWVFAGVVYGDGSARRREVERELALIEAQWPGAPLSARDLLRLRARAGELVEAAVERLAPYDVIGIATTFFQNIPALALARRLKERWPEKVVVLGGANCDGEMGMGLMRLFGFVDYVFSGEVDHAFPDFVDRLARGAPLHGVPGLYRRDPDGRIVAGPPAVPLADLDALPLPDFDDFMNERRRIGLDTVQEPVLALESSRGCWWGAKHHCTFCGLNAQGIGYRQKSQPRFREEVAFIAARYETRFLFMTDNILSMNYYDEFMAWAAEADLNIDFFYEIKANVKRSHLRRLAAAGITAVQPGIESFSTPVLSLMRKGTTAIQNVAFLKYAREYGVLPTYNILVGFPGEEPADYERMTRELPKLAHLPPPTSIPVVEYHRFSPYHQTPEQFGIRLRPSPKYRYLYPFSEEEIARIAYLFEWDGGETAGRGYLAPLTQQIIGWRRAYSEEECTLSWWEEGGDVLIADQRPGFPRRDYRLQAHAATLFHQLDAPTGLSLLLQQAEIAAHDHDLDQFLAFVLSSAGGAAPEARGDETLIRFTAREFTRDPGACLAPLIQNGLLYVEPGAPSHERYLALPVRRERRPVEARWLKVGV